MYPARTSLIPVQVALARFLKNQGIRAFFSHYPYWYLGTTPFYYLGGPIIPGLMVFLDRLIPVWNLFDVFWTILIITYLLGGTGVYLMVKSLANFSTSEDGFANHPRFPLSSLSSTFYLFGPLIAFLFPYSNGISLIAFSFIPLVLCFYLKFLQNPTKKNKILVILLISFVLLIDTNILPTLILGMIAILLSVAKKWKGIEKRIKEFILITLYSLLITSVWYTPIYWIRLLFAPSFAGKPLISVIGQITQLLPLSLAITLAVVAGRGVLKKLTLNTKYSVLNSFTFYWLFIFGFLTLMRFIADPDFFIDWTAYGAELQLGLAMLIALLLRKNYRPSITQLLNYSITFIYLLLFLFIFKSRVLKPLQSSLEDSYEYQICQVVNELVGEDETVFLSGSPVFWLNAWFDVQQMRGGADRGSVEPHWREAAWEIREGEGPEKTKDWLEKIEINWLVVHSESSAEIYHDFQHPAKFEEIESLEKINDFQGDAIYRVNFN